MASRKEVADLAVFRKLQYPEFLMALVLLKRKPAARLLKLPSSWVTCPAHWPAALREVKAVNLGVVLPYVPKAHLFSAYFFSEMLSGIGSKARDNGMDLLVMFRTPGEVMNYTDLFRRQKVDACIILGARDDHGELAAFQQLQQEGHPFCIMSQHFAGESFMEVDADHVEGSRQAIRHLTDQGYRNIAFLNGPDSYSNSQERIQGVQIGMNEAGMELDSSLLLEGNYSRRSGVEAAATIAARLDEIDAVFAANDRMAIGVMHGLRERGNQGLQDFPAFVGYDDSDAAEMAVPPLSSVRVPFYEMGELAASKLIHASLGAAASSVNTEVPSETARQLLPTELIIRASSIRN